MSKKNYFIILILILVSIIPFFLAFFYNFKDQTISRSIGDWASFGDYIGGTLNTFLSLLILLSTVYIAFQLNKFDNERNEKTIQFERNIFLRELREREYDKISQELDTLWEIVTNQDKNYGTAQLFRVYNRYASFRKYKKHLFQNLDDKVFIELDDFINNAHKYYLENDIIIMQKIPQYAQMSTLIDEFHFKLQSFLLRN